jgi:hypothetical protein
MSADGLYVMGIDKATYEELLELAKKEGKSVNEITSDALRRAILGSKDLKESKEKKLLCEG